MNAEGFHFDGQRVIEALDAPLGDVIQREGGKVICPPMLDICIRWPPPWARSRGTTALANWILAVKLVAII